MPSMQQQTIEKLLSKAGLQLNGPNSFDIQVHDERLYGRVLSQGSLGLGEAYMDGWWDSAAMDELFAKVLGAQLQKDLPINPQIILAYLSATVMNFQKPSRAFKIGEAHYDIGNDLYSKMLDKRMTYTCGYWKEATNLDDAQEAKLDLVCKKIGLKKGDRVLDIGCGWGSFAKFAAEKYGAEVVGITVSKEQVELARQMCQGLPIEIRLQDYRDVKETFDHVVSLGMFEHVGYKNYRTYMETVRRVLKPDGLFLLHTIGGNRSVHATDRWIGKYIFPNSMLPSIAQIGKSIENVFVMEDWHNFSAYYDKTLMAWYANFHRAWPELKAKYGDRFGRMWTFYLLSCAGSFRARQIQLWQIVLSPNGIKGGYQSIR